MTIIIKYFLLIYIGYIHLAFTFPTCHLSSMWNIKNLIETIDNTLGNVDPFPTYAWGSCWMAQSFLNVPKIVQERVLYVENLHPFMDAADCPSQEARGSGELHQKWEDSFFMPPAAAASQCSPSDLLRAGRPWIFFRFGDKFLMSKILCVEAFPGVVLKRRKSIEAGFWGIFSRVFSVRIEGNIFKLFIAFKKNLRAKTRKYALNSLNGKTDS